MAAKAPISAARPVPMKGMARKGPSQLNLATLFATTVVDPTAKNSNRLGAGARDAGRPG